MEQEQFKKEILPLREKLFLYARRLLDNPEDAEDIIADLTQAMQAAGML